MNQAVATAASSKPAERSKLFGDIQRMLAADAVIGTARIAGSVVGATADAVSALVNLGYGRTEAEADDAGDAGAKAVTDD